MVAVSPHQLTDIIISEVLHGADGTDICCGVIGEIGCSWPITESEKKVLRATAQAQSQLGCPVIIHPGRNAEAPAKAIRILQEAGGDISKTVMSHLDRLALSYMFHPMVVEGQPVFGDFLKLFSHSGSNSAHF